MISTKAVWNEGMEFKGAARTHHVIMDTKPEDDGKDHGPTPKELVLMGLCGCTGMDVVSILTKMHGRIRDFQIKADADSTSDDYPRVFSAIRLRYEIQGENLTAEQIRRAVELSKTKYCGVSAMLAKTATITYQMFFNGEEIR